MSNEIKERCKSCDYAKRVTANGQWGFIGCFHSPYIGKWVAEIKECPMGKENKYAKTLCM